MAAQGTGRFHFNLRSQEKREKTSWQSEAGPGDSTFRGELPATISRVGRGSRAAALFRGQSAPAAL